MKTEKLCSANGCGRKSHARGWCQMCYRRHWTPSRLHGIEASRDWKRRNHARSMEGAREWKRNNKRRIREAAKANSAELTDSYLAYGCLSHGRIGPNFFSSDLLEAKRAHIRLTRLLKDKIK